MTEDAPQVVCRVYGNTGSHHDLGRILGCISTLISGNVLW